MIEYLRKSISVPFEQLHLDPNNPRLALDEPPGYEDADALFEANLQARLTEQIWETYDVVELLDAIIAHGWMSVDAMVVWPHPDDPKRYVVVEGNRRLTALRRIRDWVLPREQKKLASMRKQKNLSKADLDEQKRLVDNLEKIISDTEQLPVVRIAADTIEELEKKLPRVLAVRHISGAKGWGNYAEDLWLLNRYHQLFKEEIGTAELRWDQSIINRVAEDASLSKTQAKRRLQACALFSHFRRDWEDQLPKGEEFKSSDYYLFECIVKKPWLRDLFEVGQDVFNMPSDREETLFKWTFKHPRGKSADANPNVFYRHENVLVWEKMKRYDDQHGTGFAQRFDVTDPDSAPKMQAVEASWLSHQARSAPAQLLEELLAQLKDMKADTLLDQADFLRDKLGAIVDQASVYIDMIDASRKRQKARRQG